MEREYGYTVITYWGDCFRTLQVHFVVLASCFAPGTGRSIIDRQRRAGGGRSTIVKNGAETVLHLQSTSLLAPVLTVGYSAVQVQYQGCILQRKLQRNKMNTNTNLHLGDFSILRIPETEDDLETTATKLEALADVARRGNSLALWTGLKGAKSRSQPGIVQGRDTESDARLQMSPMEREQYDAWKAGKCWVPEFDWKENVAAIPRGAQSLRKFGQRAAAMDVVWGRQQKQEDNDDSGDGDERARPENASWLTFNMPFMLPLTNAITRVSNAEKQAQQAPHTGLSEMEVVEMETARKIVAAAERNRTRELERIRKLTRSITENAEVLRARVQHLEEGTTTTGAGKGQGEKRRHEMEGMRTNKEAEDGL